MTVRYALSPIIQGDCCERYRIFKKLITDALSSSFATLAAAVDLFLFCSEKDCWDYRQDGGSHLSGVYTILRETSLGTEQKQDLVYCDMDTDGGG